MYIITPLQASKTCVRRISARIRAVGFRIRVYEYRNDVRMCVSYACREARIRTCDVTEFSL